MFFLKKKLIIRINLYKYININIRDYDYRFNVILLTEGVIKIINGLIVKEDLYFVFDVES